LKKIYASLHEDVVTTINADSVIDYLFASGVLCSADNLALSDVTERIRKTHKLIAILHSSSHPETFIKLHEAVKKEEAYKFLVDRIDRIRETTNDATCARSSPINNGECFV
jgi:hypothetical protein